MRNGKYELIIPPVDYPGKRYRGRYAYEHHVVFWKTHGRLRSKDCVIHHKNDQKRENIPSNLEEKTWSDHSRLHNSLKPIKYTTLVCGWCKNEFKRPSRLYKPDQDKNYCCRSHQVSAQQAKIWNRPFPEFSIPR